MPDHDQTARQVSYSFDIVIIGELKCRSGSICECQHHFCHSCLQQWLKWQKENKIPETCPLCRSWLFKDPQKIAVRPLREMVEILQGVQLLAPEGSGIDLATALTAHEGYQLP